MSVPKQYLDPEIECASTDEMRQLQTERLKHMVKHAYENVPLYQERMDAMGVSPDDIHSIDDLHKLPFTVKDDLRNTYPFGMFAVPKEELVRIHAWPSATLPGLASALNHHLCASAPSSRPDCPWPAGSSSSPVPAGTLSSWLSCLFFSFFSRQPCVSDTRTGRFHTITRIAHCNVQCYGILSR